MTSAETARPLGPRARARERTLARIVELGNQQLREHGAAGLSLREVARGLGMVSSAVYRYVGSRDELLTLLIVDAYEDLADAVDAALEAAEPSARDRFLSLARTMIRWAIRHPERWTLLYGTPVRDYDAPAETTNDAGTRVAGRVFEIAADVPPPHAAAPSEPFDPAVAPEVTELLESTLAEFAVRTDADTALRAVTAWSGLIGLISAHVFRQLGADAAAVGEQLLEVQCGYLADLIAPAPPRPAPTGR